MDVSRGTDTGTSPTGPAGFSKNDEEQNEVRPGFIVTNNLYQVLVYVQYKINKCFNQFQSSDFEYVEK